MKWFVGSSLMPSGSKITLGDPHEEKGFQSVMVGLGISQ